MHYLHACFTIHDTLKYFFLPQCSAIHIRGWLVSWEVYTTLVYTKDMGKHIGLAFIIQYREIQHYWSPNVSHSVGSKSQNIVW